MKDADGNTVTGFVPKIYLQATPRRRCSVPLETLDGLRDRCGRGARGEGRLDGCALRAREEPLGPVVWLVQV